MDKVERICNELGVRVGDHFRDRNGNLYYINTIGKTFVLDVNRNYYEKDDLYNKLILGDIVPVWSPKLNEIYYAPSVSQVLGFSNHTWVESKQDVNRFRRGFVFKTKEEAIECTNDLCSYWNGEECE